MLQKNVQITAVITTFAKLKHGISFVRSHSWLRACYIGFNKKLHTRLEQKVNYLNALSDPFDKVSHERDLSPASYHGAKTNVSMLAVRNIRSSGKYFRFCVAHCSLSCKNNSTLLICILVLRKLLYPELIIPPRGLE